MKKRILAAVAVAGFVGVIGFGASASTSSALPCNTGPTPGDVVATNPADGGVVYSDGSTFIGVSGGHGFIEVGSDHVQGSSTDVALEGRATPAPSACVNGTPIV
jgi:hypothetical protein